MKKILFLMLPLIVLFSCQSKTETTVTDSESIFNLQSEWQTQNGNEIKLEELKGKVLTVVMIYTSCKTACPRLTLDMKDIATKVNYKGKDLTYVLVSIDPKTDTPEKMTDFLKNNKIDNKQWLFLRSSEDNTREFANSLAMKYKQISPIDFSHSNIINVFSKEGILVHQKEGLAIDIDETVDAIKKQLN